MSLMSFFLSISLSLMFTRTHTHAHTHTHTHAPPSQENLRRRLESVTLPIKELQLYLDNAHIFKDTAPGVTTVFNANSAPAPALPRPLSPVGILKSPRYAMYYMYVFTHIHMCLYTYIYICVYMYICMHTHTYSCTYIYVYIPKYIYTVVSR
jgi:hypothetical protein